MRTEAEVSVLVTDGGIYVQYVVKLELRHAVVTEHGPRVSSGSTDQQETWLMITGNCTCQS